MDNTVYLISYKKEGNKWNPLMTISKKRFESKGFKVKSVKGFSLSEHPQIKKNEVVYLNFLEKALPVLGKNAKDSDGFFVAEDDAYLSDAVDFSYLEKRIKRVKNYTNKIIRIGYQKITSTGYIVGTQLVWIPRTQINNLTELMKQRRPQHFDGFLSIKRNSGCIIR